MLQWQRIYCISDLLCALWTGQISDGKYYFFKFWFKFFAAPAFFRYPALYLGILSLVFSARVNCPRPSRTTGAPRSLWRNKRWSGRTSPFRACMKTHQAQEAERLIWNQTVGQKKHPQGHWIHTLVIYPLFLFYFVFWTFQSEMIKNIFCFGIASYCCLYKIKVSLYVPFLSELIKCQQNA